MPDCLMRKKEVALGTEWLQRMLDTRVAADEATMLNADVSVGAKFIGYNSEEFGLNMVKLIE